MPGWSVDVGGVAFPDQVVVGGQDIPLRGTAVQKWKVFWTVHSTAWWQGPTALVHDDIGKVLELYYFHDIPAKGFREATTTGISMGRTAPEVAELQARIDAWNAAYVDVKEGDRYRIVYAPGKGTALVHNGVEITVVPGLDFANAVFDIWLGDKPVDVGHRNDLQDGK